MDNDFKKINSGITDYTSMPNNRVIVIEGKKEKIKKIPKWLTIVKDESKKS